MQEGLNSVQIKRFHDLLIMANKYQLESMGQEVLKELKKRRQIAEMPVLPVFLEGDSYGTGFR